MKFLNKWKFRGAKIPKHKNHTKDKPVEEMAAPRRLYFPMDMHIGKPAGIMVSVGDTVKIGTLLGSDKEGISANIHSSVSGRVIETGKGRSVKGETEWVVVENDFKDEWEYLEELEGELTPESFSARLEEAGVTGKGGAGFPASIKYDMSEAEVKYLLVNGAECEPYSTADYRCIMEYAEEIVKVCDLISKVYELDEAWIALEDHMTEPAEKLRDAIQKADSKVQIHLLPSEYPQGHAGLQIRAVLGIELEEGQRSGDAGILQSNVSTVQAIHDAIYKNEPLTRRIITVTGPELMEPRNLMVRAGTTFEDLISYCGGLKKEEAEIISGGPMMGKAVLDKSLSVDKNTTTVLLLEKKEKPEEMNCIRCSKCIIHCPVDLQPILISNSLQEQAYDRAPALRSESCISCGTCTFICPARIPLLANIQEFNRKWEELKDE